MKVYKFDKDFEGYIEPMPGDIVELEGVRLKVVEDDTTGYSGEGCHNCVLNYIFRYDDIKQDLLKFLCLDTGCNGATREDGLDIHYEEVKDGQ